MIDALWHHIRIEDDFGQFVNRFERNLTGIQLVDFCQKELFAELWLEFQATVVMMDAVREPNSLQVNNESQPVGIVLVAFVMRIDGLQCLANLQSITTVLIPKNVSARTPSCR